MDTSLQEEYVGVFEMRLSLEMTIYVPITLVGNSLGERHRHLNALVNDAYQNKVPFQSIQDAPELSAVDRLFKIDLASKLRHTGYILSNLKEDDMLYVSRALQCSWLLEPQYHDVINPRYLEEVLYPEMTKTAVNKMNNWLHVNLKESNRCLEFFQYYSQRNIDFALKFLWNCSEDVIADAIAKIPKKITPKHLKLLCEKCTRAVRTFYEVMIKDNYLIDQYLQDERRYYSCLTNLINTDPDLLLDIAEKYFNQNCCDSFSSNITRIIMSKHKDRYLKKPELYAAWLLHMPTLAKCLNSDEIKDIVLRLARGKYLGPNFFSYQLVEPMIKQLSQDERIAFQKKVFIDKFVGDEIKDWPYESPSSPYTQRNVASHIFDDKKYEPDGDCRPMECCLMSIGEFEDNRRWFQVETLLDKLFNKYRCISFKDTFLELSKQIPAESLVQNRQYMMLVLVSKTGGRVEYVKDLLDLLVSKHKNEADNFRATIVRSLVKRAKVWRLPDDLWQLFLKFAQGLGLDGEKSDENCFEGLHAVVLRNILFNVECSPKVFSAYLNQFSTFYEYTLNENEKRKVFDKLPFMFLASAKEQTDIKEAVLRLEAALKVIKEYKLNINHCPELVTVITSLASQDSEACLDLLKQLYNARLVRKDLYRENFTFLQTNESYLNILRHDSQFLLVTDKFGKLASEKIYHDQFLRKLAIYFSESEGLAENYLNIIRKEMMKIPRTDLARSFAILAGSSLYKHLHEVDRVTEKTTEQKKMAVALRTYAHLARPKLDLTKLGWHAAGVKAMANQISICSANKVEENMRLLSDWPRAAKLSLLLAERIGREVEILPEIARVRPTVAIKFSLRYLKQRGEFAFDPQVWEIAKAILEKIELSEPKHAYIRERLSEVEKMPDILRADYGAVVYKVFRKISREEGMKVLIKNEDHLQNADDKFLIEVLRDFLEYELTLERAQKDEYPDNVYAYWNLRMIANFLLLCKSEDVQKQRMEAIGKRFLSLMKTFYDKAKDLESRNVFVKYWNCFMYTLKNTNVVMDSSYISSLPVLQHIVEWLKETVSVVEHVDIFSTMHFIMLYFKAIRQSVKHNPLIFSDKYKRNEIGVEIVGVVYGKYISHELIQLKTEYFESIVEIYAKVLIAFLSAVFPFGKSFSRFVSALIRGILEEKDGTSLLLCEKVFIEYRFSLQELYDEKPLSLLKGLEDKQLKFFLNEDIKDIFAEVC